MNNSVVVDISNFIRESSAMISVIVPCFNEQEALPYFVQKIKHIAERMHDSYQIEIEFLFVNDGSQDNTLTLLREFAKQDKRINYLSFSRNFGKEGAMYAGLIHAKGDYVAIMDADLQHPPELLMEMYEALMKDGEYDCVAAQRIDRKGEPLIRSFLSQSFYKLINKISETEIVKGGCDFRLMTRQMVDAIVSMEEYNRFSKGIFSWVGFRTKWLPYENVERVAGETKWSFWQLFKYSLQGIVAFSTAPLAIASIVGLLSCLAAFVLGLYTVGSTIIFGNPVSGWPSLVCMILFMGGAQLFCIGILGQYLAKTYLETKKRPIFIVKEASENIEIKNK